MFSGCDYLDLLEATTQAWGIGAMHRHAAGVWGLFLVLFPFLLQELLTQDPKQIAERILGAECSAFCVDESPRGGRCPRQPLVGLL